MSTVKYYILPGRMKLIIINEVDGYGLFETEDGKRQWIMMDIVERKD